VYQAIEGISSPLADSLRFQVVVALVSTLRFWLRVVSRRPAWRRRSALTLLGCYFPQRMAKAPFFERCAQIAVQETRQPLLMIGDFNTGRNDLEIEPMARGLIAPISLWTLARKAALSICGASTTVIDVTGPSVQVFRLIVRLATKRSLNVSQSTAAR
jgi:hypothetical protein